MKKIIVTILTVVFALTLAFGVVGCGGSEDAGSACKHKAISTSYKQVDAENHTYKCSLCKETITQKHKWTEGVADGNGNPTYKCVCGAFKN